MYVVTVYKTLPLSKTIPVYFTKYNTLDLAEEVCKQFKEQGYFAVLEKIL